MKVRPGRTPPWAAAPSSSGDRHAPTSRPVEARRTRRRCRRHSFAAIGRGPRAGADKTRILRAQVFLADIADIAGMNEAWDAWGAPGHAPPRATAEARLARPEWKVEIVVTTTV